MMNWKYLFLRQFIMIQLEFIHLITSEANDICEKTTKKTINGDMILQALKNLQFEEYVKELEAEIVSHKIAVKVEYYYYYDFHLFTICIILFLCLF